MAKEGIGKDIGSATMGLAELCELSLPFAIPSYQRGYEWGAYNVSRFVESVYEGREKDTFLGAVQFSLPDGEDGVYQIVDGRQRLTTLCLFYAILSKRSGFDPLPCLRNILDDEELLKEIKAIHEGDESYLKPLSTIGRKGDVTRLNRNGKDEAEKASSIYHRNALYIATILAHPTRLEKRGEGEFKSPDQLGQEDIRKMFESIFFITVSIKRRELGDVIRIFDTLNSTGQPLSSEAMFKLRYHSFLRNHFDSLTPQQLIDEINRGYAKVEDYNFPKGEEGKDKEGFVPVHMGDVLWGFRTYLVMVCGDSVLTGSDLTYGSLGFFEMIFRHEGFDFKLASLERFHQYVDYHLEFYATFFPKDGNYGLLSPDEAIDRIILDLLKMTRYGGSWAIPVALYGRLRMEGKPIDDAYKEAVKAGRLIFQPLFYLSLIYQKSVKWAKTSMMLEMIRKCKDIEDLHGFCKERIQAAEKNRHDNERYYKPFWYKVQHDLYAYRDQAYSFLSIIEAHLEMDGERKDFERFLETVFPWQRKKARPQIEHIYAQDLIEKSREFLEDEEQKAKLNGLGNLVLLEESINKNNNLKAAFPSEKFQSPRFFEGSKLSSPKALLRGYGDIAGGVSKEEDVNRWLVEVVDSRYQEMREVFLGYFPLFTLVE